MAAYKTPYDIASRALQHCRKNRIDNFKSNSATSQETGFAYDKLREAELRANLWRFATKRTILRAIDSTFVVWTPPSYAAGTTFAVGSIVIDTTGDWWQSKVASNLGNTPAPGDFWGRYFGPDCMDTYDATVAYFPGEMVISGGLYYLSLISNNKANTPVSSAADWLPINGTAVALQILYPIGTGPSSNTTSMNVFRLPKGFLRQAPTNPKGGTSVFLGAPNGNWPEDWVFESNYLISASPGPIMLRFVADFVDVPDMDSEFCEMLASRIAEEVGPVLVEDKNILGLILKNARDHYKTERNRAAATNGIEIGPISMDLDTYITCRI